MPAIERSYTADDPGTDLYLDTDFLINCLFSTEPHYDRCRAFLERLFGLAVSRLYVSSLTWMEYAHAITRESFRAHLPTTSANRFRLDRWDQTLVRETYMTAMLAALQQLLDRLNWYEIVLDADVRRLAIQYMATHRLGSQDAVHLASANYFGVFDIVSFDRGFRRVDGLNLWNDRVYAGEPLR